MTRRSKDAADGPVGLAVLDDPKGLAAQVTDALRSAAHQIGGPPRRSRGFTRPKEQPCRM